jgi:hypothetical protein
LAAPFGEKTTFTVQETPGARGPLEMQVVDGVNSWLSVWTPVIVTGARPTLVTVTVMAALVLPIACPGKERLQADGRIPPKPSGLKPKSE